MDRIDKIINDVKKYGDRAVIKYTQEFDNFKISAKEIEVGKKERKVLTEKVPAEMYGILKQAAENIKSYCKSEHKEEVFKNRGFSVVDRYIPVSIAGIYVPGGSFPYPSTVLMCALPARMAGVKELVMSTPPGNLTPSVAAAAELAGVDRIFRLGGVQAIAAMAFGTDTVAKVDKIAGPGNRFVTEAKRRLSNVVGIDMIAGPSEVVIIAGEGQEPDWVAYDLLAQAEHGEDSRSILISESEGFIKEVEKRVPEEFLDRIEFIKASGVEDALGKSNDIAPEHLQIMLSPKESEKAEALVKNAGAVFLGPYSPACTGDYWAGPSHTLPTAKSARFSEGLSTRSFLKKVSFIKFSPQAMKKDGGKIAALAAEEGMNYHRMSAEVRCEDKESSEEK